MAVLPMWLDRLRLWRSKPSEQTTAREELAEQPSETTLTVFSPAGNCALCGFNRANEGAWPNAVSTTLQVGVCSIRGFDIHEPGTTYCKNFESRDPVPFGAIYSLLPTHGNAASPWVDLAAPQVRRTNCCICDAKSDVGVTLHLPDGDVGCCGPEHYLAWWTDYLRRRLAYFKLLGEKAYSDMYDVVSFSTAAAYYSDAKEAFYSAISIARDLELAKEKLALETRLAHTKDVYRHQFR